MASVLKQHDPLGRFYSSTKVSESLVSLINANPKEVLDLGSGLGALATAASKRWANAKIITVDIDESSQKIEAVFKPRKNQHQHIISDILDLDFPRHALHKETVGVVVTNPPYLVTEWRKSFEGILEDAGLSQLIRRDTPTSAELIFFAQGLRLSRTNGHISLIVPDGFVTGHSHKEFRSVITKNFNVETVVQLPEGAFQGTRARAFILMITKRAPLSASTTLLKMHSDGSLSDPILLNHKSKGDRLDYNYHYAHNSKEAKSYYSLSDIGAEIIRGKLSSSEIRCIEHSTLHTTSFSQVVNGVIALPNRVSKAIPLEKHIVAETGDILLARVDRSLQDKVAIISKGQALISDCLYRIRVAPYWREAVLKALLNKRGKEMLRASTRGVGARMLPKHELQKIPLILKSGNHE